MFKKKFFNTIITDKSLILILFFLSFFVNQYYGNIGVFPIDTFLHFDSSYRVFKNEYPGHHTTPKPNLNFLTNREIAIGCLFFLSTNLNTSHPEILLYSPQEYD